MSPCLSFSHPCLSFSLYVAVSLSSTPVSLPIFLSPTMPLFLWFSLSLSLSLSRSCLSFSLPVLSLFLSFSLCDSLCIFLPRLFLSLSLSPSFSLLSLSLSFSRPYLSISLEPRSLFLSLSLSLLSFFLSFSLTPCLSVYLFSRSLSHPCLCLFFLTLISFSRSLSLCLSVSLSLSLSLSLSPTLFLSLPLLSLFPSFLSPIPVVFLSFSHSCLPFYLCLTPVSPSPSLWFSLSLSLPPLSLFISFSLPPMYHFFISFSLSFFCFFRFFIFTTRDLSRTMVRRVWRFLLPADHRIGGLICPCLVAWSPWFIFLLYTYDYLYFILFSFQISVVI